MTTAANETYVDASALAKLILDEPESDALEEYVRAERIAFVSSAIVRVEVTRAVRVAVEPGTEAELARLFDRVTFVRPDDPLLALAASLADARLRSLDAIHLASALTVGAKRMLVYDHRLAEGAEAAGIEAVAPGA